MWGVGPVEIHANLDQWCLGIAQRAVKKSGMRIAGSKGVPGENHLVVQVDGAFR
jgi:hypothetical protein